MRKLQNFNYIYDYQSQNDYRIQNQKKNIHEYDLDHESFYSSFRERRRKNIKDRRLNFNENKNEIKNKQKIKLIQREKETQKIKRRTNEGYPFSFSESKELDLSNDNNNINKNRKLSGSGSISASNCENKSQCNSPEKAEADDLNESSEDNFQIIDKLTNEIERILIDIYNNHIKADKNIL